MPPTNCALCEYEADAKPDFWRCGKKKHSFWLDPVGISFPKHLNPGLGQTGSRQ